MCGDYFNLNAQPNPETPRPPVNAYHVHIYFQPGTASEQDAVNIVQKLDERFPGAIKNAHRVGKVGPHIETNIGATILPESFGEVVSWLQMNSKGLSILVHPRTGDEWVDHKEAAMWLGEQVGFNEKFFEPLKPKKPQGPTLQ